MSKAWLEDRERALEDEYFHRRDQELIARLREQGRLEQERQVLRSRLWSVDDHLPAELQAAGFTADGLALLHLLPLVDVAWADKGITARERDLVPALATSRGVAQDSPEHRRLEGWLERRPEQEIFDTAYEAIKVLLAQQDEAGATTRLSRPDCRSVHGGASRGTEEPRVRCRRGVRVSRAFGCTIVVWLCQTRAPARPVSRRAAWQSVSTSPEASRRAHDAGASSRSTVTSGSSAGRSSVSRYRSPELGDVQPAKRWPPSRTRRWYVQPQSRQASRVTG